MLSPSLDLVRRTLDAEAAYTLSRLQVLERLPGNPSASPIGASRAGRWRSWPGICR